MASSTRSRARSRWSPAPPRGSAARPPACSTPAAPRWRWSTSTPRRPSGPPTGSATGRWRSPPTSPTPRRWRAAVDEVVERFGGLDVVVANAGVAPPTRPMSVVDTEAFERTIEIDLLGVWRTVHPALPQVIERRGHVVVVASVYAFVNGVMATPYAVSQGRGRAARPGAAGRALDPRGERQRRLLRLHRHADGPRRVRGPGRPGDSRTCSRRRHAAAPARRRRRGRRSSRGSSAACRGSSARAGGGPARSCAGSSTRSSTPARPRRAHARGRPRGRAPRPRRADRDHPLALVARARAVSCRCRPGPRRRARRPRPRGPSAAGRESHSSTVSSARSSVTPRSTASSPRNPAASLSASRRCWPSDGKAPIR